MKHFFTVLVIVLSTCANSVLAQTPKNAYFKEVREGIEHIYNQEFQESQQIIGRLERSMQGSAIPDLMKALQLYWAQYPIQLKKDKLVLYHKFLDNSYQRSLAVLDSDPGNPEAIFLAMASQGMLAESYAESGRNFKAVGAAKRAYNYIKLGSDKMDQLKEFYLSTGLYNYYREYYPETYPVYKPFMSFFMKGNKKTGIQQLETAAKEASIAHVIAKYYLSYIYLRYEYVPVKALRQAKNLHDTYPKNLPFTAIYLESLIINDRFQEAYPIAKMLQAQNSPYLKIYGVLFMGVIEEKLQKDFVAAEKHYRNTLALNEQHKMQRSHLEAFAYLGLGRIYEQKQDPQARKFFKEAMDQASTKALKAEAKNHLN